MSGIVGDNSDRSSGVIAAAGGGGVDGITSSANATAISITANEEVTMPKQPCFLFYENASQDNITGDNTDYQVSFNTEVFDQNDDFASDTFTAPVTGKYLITANVSVSAGTTSSHTTNRASLVSSNRTIRIATSNTSGWLGAYNFMWGGSVVLDMDASDTCHVVYRVGPSGKTVDLYGDGTGNVHNYMSGCLLA
jgi:hypothetical protein